MHFKYISKIWSFIRTLKTDILHWPEFLFLYVYYLLRLQSYSKLTTAVLNKLVNSYESNHLYDLYAIIRLYYRR